MGSGSSKKVKEKRPAATGRMLDKAQQCGFLYNNYTTL